MPVLHDISDGGAAVALSEICIASGVGAEVTLENPFSEDTHRFLAVFEPGRVELPEDSARRLGTIGGDHLVINGAAAELTDIDAAWSNAISDALKN